MFIRKKILFLLIIYSSNAWSQEAIGSSGDSYENESIVLSFTLGEPFIETLDNENTVLTQGFHQVYEAEVSDVLSTQIEDSKILVYPNPTKEILKINSLGKKLSEYMIYDLKGKLILHERINAPKSDIDLSEIGDGSYRLILATSENQMISYLIVKIR